MEILFLIQESVEKDHDAKYGSAPPKYNDTHNNIIQRHLEIF